jgi:hypothetical protein
MPGRPLPPNFTHRLGCWHLASLANIVALAARTLGVLDELCPRALSESPPIGPHDITLKLTREGALLTMNCITRDNSHMQCSAPEVLTLFSYVQGILNMHMREVLRRDGHLARCCHSLLENMRCFHFTTIEHAASAAGGWRTQQNTGAICPEHAHRYG